MFIRPHLDYSDVVYDHPSNDAFSNCSVQCSFSNCGSNKRYILRKIVSRIRVRISSKYKINETPFSVLQIFYSTKLPAYIYDFIPLVRQSQKHLNTFNSFSCRTEYFKKSFFPRVISEWNKLNAAICSSGSYNILQKSLSNFIRSNASKVYSINDTISIKLITRIRVGFNHLRQLKFKHNFQDTLNPYCSCSIEAESTFQYFMRCHFFDALQASLMKDLRNIDSDNPTLRYENLIIILLYRNQIYDNTTDQNNINA